MEVAALGLKVEGVESIDRARDSLGRFVKASQDAEKSTENVKGASGRARDEFGRFKKSTDDAAKGASGLGKESEKASKSIFGFGRSSDSAAGSLNSLGSTATKVGGVLAAAFSITKVVQYADAWSDMQSRVGAATGQMDLAAGNMQRLLQIANASYSPLQQTAEIYARNVSTFRDLGRGASEAADFTESLNNMLVLTATRGERAASVQNALSKAMAVGKIEADGLETVLANGGEVAQALARELGTTVSGLRSMASQGKITGDVIASAVVKSLDDVRDRAAEMPATMGDAWTRVGNNLTAFVGIMDQATGVSGSLANAIIGISDAALEIATDGDVIAGFVAWKGTIEAIAQDFVSLGALISDFTSNTLGDADSISFSFGEMPANIRAMIKIAVVEIASFIDAQMNGIRALGAAIEALPSGPSAAMDAFNAVRAQMEQLGQVRMDSINDILVERDAIIQAGRDAANSYAETGRKALEFNGAVAQTTGTVGTFTKEQEKAVKALSDFVAQSALSVSNAAAMTAAYLSGSEAVAKLTREQKIEAEVLKLGEKNRAEVTRRINEMEDALESLDLAKSIAQMRDQNAELTAYGKVLALGGTATQAGREALKQYNNEREIEAALVGKTSAEITKLIPKLREEQKVRDSLREGNARIERLNALVAETRTVTEKANAELAELAELAASTKDPVYLDAINRKMKEVQASTSEWGQFTERALDSVDQAFADAWKNIDQGFSGFADGLKNAFKNLLAELAHMAITRPIIMQIGAAMGIGGLQSGGQGLLGSLLGGGGSSGIGGITDLFNLGKNAYSLYSSGFGQAVMAGWNSGGLTGAISGGWGYGSSAVSGLFGGGSAAGAGGAGFGLGQPLVTGGVGNAGFASGGMFSGSAAWGAPTSALAGIGGALYGYGKSGWKGAVTGGAGAYVGAALGSIAGPIGTAIGAALGGYIGGSLFGGKWQTKDVGIALGIESGALTAQEYEYQKKKGGLFGSNKKRTRFYDLDAETSKALGDMYAATADGVFDIFESLSYTIEESALAGLDLARTQISTKGKTEEEIEQAIAEWFGKAADAMTAELQSVFGTGLDLDFAGMQAFVGNLKGVNEVIRYLNVGMFDMSVAGGKLAEQLSGISGGLENLANNAGTYYAAFFTEAEKIEDTIDSIKRSFEAANTELASSREAYRAMVEDIDITTEAGQEMFATLMSLSGQAAAYYDILEARAAQAQAKLAQGFNDSAAIAQGAFAALQAAIGREASKIQASMQKTSSNIGQLTQLSNSLSNAIRTMRMNTQEFDRMARERARDQLSSALSAARSGGSLLGVDLSGSLNELGRSSADLFESFEDYARDYWRTANDINELNKLTGKQLTNEEQSLANQQLQLEKYDLMLADAQNQLNALYGINTSVLSVAAALAGFQSALKSAQAAPKSNQQLVEAAYQSVLGRAGESEGVAFWTDALNKGTVTPAKLAEVMASAASAPDRDRLKAMGVPGFAAGGAFTNGIVQRPTAFNMAVMGEAGAEGILPLANVGGRLGVHASVSKGDSAEVTMLRQELSAMREILLDMRVNAKITADSVQNMNESGVIIDNSENLGYGT